MDSVPAEAEETEQDPEWTRAYDAICARVERAIGEETDIRFSAHAEDDNGIPIDNLDDVAYRDYVVIVAEREEYWGGRSSETFQSEFLDEPTWLELCKIAHKQSKVTRDRQHVFVEGIKRVGWIKVDGRSAAKCELLLGS